MLIRSYIIIPFILITLVVVNQKAIAQTKQQMDTHRQHFAVPLSADDDKNPYFGNAAITDTGKVTYKKICSVCHGDSGKGDGIAAAGLSVRPADHTSEIVQAQTDGALFYVLSNGHAPMPAYKSILSEKQRWALINYIRTLKPKPKASKK